MMGYYSQMMGGWGWSGMGLLGLITWLEVVIIGALLIAWLWKKVNK